MSVDIKLLSQWSPGHTSIVASTPLPYASPEFLIAASVGETFTASVLVSFKAPGTEGFSTILTIGRLSRFARHVLVHRYTKERGENGERLVEAVDVIDQQPIVM